MIFRIPALLIALTVHEFAHAWVAVRLGDPTPRFMGRLTLNPVAHLDPIGLLMLWLFKFGWAKPVPINPNNFTNWRRGVLLVSLAGAGGNIVTAFLAALILAANQKLHFFPGQVWVSILGLTYSYNLVLAVFNLIPIPPLDGAQVVTSLLRGREAYFFDRIAPYGPFILIGLVYVGLVGALLYPPMVFLSTVLNKLVAVII